MYAELTAFGRTFRLSYTKVPEEIEEDEDGEEDLGPPVHIDTPMKTYANDLGFRARGNGGGVSREIET